MNKIKRISFILLFAIFITISSYANMASPTIHGSTISEAYSSRHMDIIHEQIKITHIDVYRAKFTIIYTVKSDYSAWSVPLIFDTMTDNYSEDGSFRAWVDESEVAVSEVPSTYENKDALQWIDSLDHNISYLEKDAPNLIGLKFFKVDLCEGIHTIKVEYTAFAEQNLIKKVKTFSYSYNLKPARYWRSFGCLDIELDATALKGTYTVNFSGTDTIPNGPISHWLFTEIPAQDFFIINFEPSVNVFARVLLAIGTDTITLILSILLIALHIFFIIKYRITHPNKKYSPVVVLGSIALPLLCCFIYILSADFIDWVIGDFASKRHGYIFLIFFSYPVLLPIYWVAMWLIDSYKKQNLKTKQND